MVRQVGTKFDRTSDHRYRRVPRLKLGALGVHGWERVWGEHVRIINSTNKQLLLILLLLDESRGDIICDQTTFKVVEILSPKADKLATS